MDKLDYARQVTEDIESIYHVLRDVQEQMRSYKRKTEERIAFVEQRIRDAARQHESALRAQTEVQDEFAGRVR